MTDRVAGLLLKAVQALPAGERDEVLAALIGSALARSAPVTADQPGPLPALGALASGVPGTVVAARLRAPGPRPMRWIRGMQPLGTRDAISSPLPGEQEALKVLPVRLPATDYERLRVFSREHGFSMAVIIRTLVERFLDGQARRWASQRDEPAGPEDDLDEQGPAGHA
jgi:hypothetical protein